MRGPVGRWTCEDSFINKIKPSPIVSLCFNRSFRVQALALREGEGNYFVLLFFLSLDLLGLLCFICAKFLPHFSKAFPF
ncbi:hypothetical protein K2173_010041 [Erythroxylum novogranatense]|uniref:Transmembrane protein n=1 Tax=Erythroxylum novogranatense TaxID=1862640 RepID=A0AAV8TTH3_9ROSI|nr:hypothetical protein K2173_010041 [Erythroxylum novogranatense]